eukprot:06186_6
MCGICGSCNRAATERSCNRAATDCTAYASEYAGAQSSISVASSPDCSVELEAITRSAFSIASSTAVFQTCAGDSGSERREPSAMSSSRSSLSSSGISRSKICAYFQAALHCSLEPLTTIAPLPFPFSNSFSTPASPLPSSSSVYDISLS